MIVIQDVFVITHRVEDKNYTEQGDTRDERRQMTIPSIIEFETYEKNIGDALEEADLAEADQIHWSRKVTHVDG